MSRFGLWPEKNNGFLELSALLIKADWDIDK